MWLVWDRSRRVLPGHGIDEALQHAMEIFVGMNPNKSAIPQDPDTSAGPRVPVECGDETSYSVVVDLSSVKQHSKDGKTLQALSIFCGVRVTFYTLQDLRREHRVGVWGTVKSGLRRVGDVEVCVG